MARPTRKRGTNLAVDKTKIYGIIQESKGKTITLVKGRCIMGMEKRQMAFVGETPWHGEGKSVKDKAIMVNAEAFANEAGINYPVDTCELFCQDSTPVPSRGVYRIVEGKKKILGVVGPRWQPLQNIDAFKWFQPWLDAGLAEFHTAGALFEGEKVWVLAKLALDNIDIAKNDTVMPYILLSNSHDGKNAVRVGFNPIRVVCWNTLSAAISNGVGKMIRIRHTTKVNEKLELVRETMNLAKQDFEANAEQYKRLASKQFNQADIKKYVKVLMGVDDTKDEELPTRTVNRMAGIMELIFKGKGQDNPAIQGSWWQAYNGVNEAINWTDGRTTANRLDNLWFGQGLTKNNDALQLALEMAG